MKTGLYLGLSPLLIVVLGGLLLMVTEAFSHRREEGDSRHSRPVVGPRHRRRHHALRGRRRRRWACGSSAPTSSRALRDVRAVPGRSTASPSSSRSCSASAAALAALLAGGYLPEHKLDRGEFYPLLIFSTVGAITLAASGDLLSLFLGLETMSLGVYALTGFRRASPRSAEAAVKYFLLGSFAAALLLYGGALLYGATGHTDLAGIRDRARGRARSTSALVLVAAALVLAGLLFKVSAVPFHMWTPDAYEGAPTPATGFMAVAVKSAAFAMLLRVLLRRLRPRRELASWGTGWPPVLALPRRAHDDGGQPRRRPAGVGEAHARLLEHRARRLRARRRRRDDAHRAAGRAGQRALLPARLHRLDHRRLRRAHPLRQPRRRGRQLRGPRRHRQAPPRWRRSRSRSSCSRSPACRRRRGSSASSSSSGRRWAPGLYWLAVILLLNSVLGAYYYLRVLVFMYMREPAPGGAVARPMRSGYVATALVVAAVLVVVLGLWPTTSLHMAVEAALASR